MENINGRRKVGGRKSRRKNRDGTIKIGEENRGRRMENKVGNQGERENNLIRRVGKLRRPIVHTV